MGVACTECKGHGYKEAGHFLRNIGFDQDLAILDRHILKNLKKLGVIDSVPVDPLFDCAHMVADCLRNLDTPHLRA
jgi:thermostable 8-oxoguanine DNA glycosylase